MKSYQTCNVILHSQYMLLCVLSSYKETWPVIICVYLFAIAMKTVEPPSPAMSADNNKTESSEVCGCVV